MLACGLIVRVPLEMRESSMRTWSANGSACYLALCPDYRADGALPALARTMRRDGAANERRAQPARLAPIVAPLTSNEAIAPA
jgi:hypothetical protein